MSSENTPRLRATVTRVPVTVAPARRVFPAVLGLAAAAAVAATVSALYSSHFPGTSMFTSLVIFVVVLAACVWLGRQVSRLGRRVVRRFGGGTVVAPAEAGDAEQARYDGDPYYDADPDWDVRLN